MGVLLSSGIPVLFAVRRSIRAIQPRSLLRVYVVCFCCPVDWRHISLLPAGSIQQTLDAWSVNPKPLQLRYSHTDCRMHFSGNTGNLRNHEQTDDGVLDCWFLLYCHSGCGVSVFGSLVQQTEAIIAAVQRRNLHELEGKIMFISF